MTVIAFKIVEDYWHLCFMCIYAQLKVACIVGCSAILPRNMTVVAHSVIIECFTTDVAICCIVEGFTVIGSHYHIHRLSKYLVDFRYLSLNQSINQSKRIYIAPYVAGESEACVGLG